MAKSQTVNLGHEYVSRGESYILSDLLEWADSHLTSEGEDGEDAPSKSLADWACYGILRAKALYKDQKRHDAGKLASRLYAPRLDTVKEKPRGLAPLVEGIKDMSARLAPEKPAPKAKPTKASKPRKSTGEQRAKAGAAEVKKAHDRVAKVATIGKPKVSKPAPESKVEAPPAAPPKAPVVRKAASKPEAPKAEPVKAPAPKPASKVTEEFTMVGGKLVEVAK